MANVRKPIFENPVYCEILFRMGTNKVWANDFVKHFELDHFLLRKGIQPRKKQSVLSRQLEVLKEEGYLKVITKENGKNFQHNKKLYYINFDKLIDEYLNYYVRYLQNKMQNNLLKINPQNYKKKIDKINSEKFRDNSKKNDFVNFFFREIMADPRHTNIDLRYLSLKEIFDIIIYSNFLLFFRSRVEEELSRELYDEKGIRKKNFTLKDVIQGNLREEYKFFENEFILTLDIGDMDYVLELLNNELPIWFAQVLREGFPKGRKDFLNMSK